MTAPATATASKPFTVVVTALDQYNNIATGYRGTVHFTSTGIFTSLPNDYTFTMGDSGVHTFTNGVTLRQSGTQTIKVFDVNNQSLTSSDVVSVGGSIGSFGSLAIAAVVGSAGARLDKPMATKPRARIKLRHAALSAAAHLRAIARADAARERVLAEFRGRLRAFLIAERAVGRRLD